jgi:hypothetical protein
MIKFYEVSEEAIDRFYQVFNKKIFQTNFGFQFIGSEKQKNLIVISKLPDQYSFLLNKELLVTINENFLEKFDDESIDILIEQEIDKISEDMESGKIKMLKPNLVTFTSLLSKWGVDKVTRANGIEELYHRQKMDGNINPLEI